MEESERGGGGVSASLLVLAGADPAWSHSSEVQRLNHSRNDPLLLHLRPVVLHLTRLAGGEEKQ